MEGNSKEAKKLIFFHDYAKNQKNLLLFEISEEFLSQLKTEKTFAIKGTKKTPFFSLFIFYDI